MSLPLHLSLEVTAAECQETQKHGLIDRDCSSCSRSDNGPALEVTARCCMCGMLMADVAAEINNHGLQKSQQQFQQHQQDWAPGLLQSQRERRLLASCRAAGVVVLITAVILNALQHPHSMAHVGSMKHHCPLCPCSSGDVLV